MMLSWILALCGLIMEPSGAFLYGKTLSADADWSRAALQTGGQLPLKTAAASWTPDWPHEESDLAPDPQIVFGRLANGFRYVVLPNNKPKGRTSLHLVVLAGALNETEAQRGIAHFLEHMLFNGSTHYPPGELVKYFQRIGMQFGPDANAHTGFYETVYDINLPNSDRKSLQEALQVMQDYAEGALLLPAEIERERNVIMSEKQTRDSADYRAYVESLGFELAGTRFPDRLPIGTESVIQSADRTLFKDFYDTWYRPDNMVLVMVGDVDTDLARDLVEKQFASMAARAPARAIPATGEVKHEGLQTFYHHEQELGSTSVTLEVLSNAPNQQDTAAYERRQIIEELANQIIQYRLNRKINQAGSPITDASTGSGTFLRQVRYGFISADCQPNDWRRVLAMIEKELRQALQYGFREDEIERVKKDYRAGLEKAAAQAETRDSTTLAQQLIFDISSGYVTRSPAQELTFADDILATVSSRDLLEGLRSVWEKDHRLVLVSGNAEITPSSGSPEDEIAVVFTQSQSEAVLRPTAPAKVSFPYLEPPSRPGQIADQEAHADLGIFTFRFANNIRLNFKRTDFSADEVDFVLSFGKGRAGVPLDISAIAAVADDVINESGFGRLDKETLAQALAGTKTRMQFSMEDDRFTFEGRSTPGEIELMFQLLYAAINDQAYREDAWQLALRRYRQTYQAALQSVDSVMNIYGWRFFSSNDPRFGWPSPEELEKLAVDHVKNWIDKALRHGGMELSIVGDVDRETVVRLASRYLGSLPAREDTGDEKTLFSGPSVPEAQQMNISVVTQVNKALLVMALPTADLWDIKRTRRLNVLAEIISERLRVRVREKLGAAYSTAAFSWPSRAYRDYGMMIVYIPLASETLDMVRAEVRAILLDIGQQGVNQEELQRALEPILTGIRDRFRENPYWLKTVLAGASQHPEQLEWSRTIMADYAGIQTDDIDAIARRYIDLSKLAVIEARAVSTP